MLRLISIALLLTLDTSFAFTEYNSTVRDILKDGFDAVYRFHKLENVLRKEGIDSTIEHYDVHFRKSADPQKVLVYLKNIMMIGAGNDSDYINKLSLPIVVDEKNEISIIPSDTSKSVDQKFFVYGILEECNKARKQILTGIAPETTKFVKKGKSEYFSECEREYTIEEADGKVKITGTSKRSQCTEMFIVKKYSEYGATDVDGESTEMLGFDYDKVTGQFFGMVTQMQGKLVNSEKDIVHLVDSFNFVGYQEIQEVFDETKNVPQKI